jgi:hypothetical protein
MEKPAQRPVLPGAAIVEALKSLSSVRKTSPVTVDLAHLLAHLANGILWRLKF